MIFLDTNAVIWLYQGEVEKFSSKVKNLIENNDVLISPMVQLELQYLLEIKRLKVQSSKIIDSLYSDIGLTQQNVPLTALIEKAMHESWTRDPFDRLIVAHAKINNAQLVTKDATIFKKLFEGDLVGRSIAITLLEADLRAHDFWGRYFMEGTDVEKEFIKLKNKYLAKH